MEENGSSLHQYLLFAWSPTGYELRERDGDPPDVGTELVDDGHEARRDEDRALAATRRPAAVRVHDRPALKPARHPRRRGRRARPRRLWPQASLRDPGPQRPEGPGGRRRLPGRRVHHAKGAVILGPGDGYDQPANGSAGTVTWLVLRHPYDGRQRKPLAPSRTTARRQPR